MGVGAISSLFQTAEWTVPDGDERLEKLVAYARRIGLPEPHRDSFDKDETEQTREQRGF